MYVTAFTKNKTEKEISDGIFVFSGSSIVDQNTKDQLRKKLAKYIKEFTGSDFTVNYDAAESMREIVVFAAFNSNGKSDATPKNFHLRAEFKIPKNGSRQTSTIVSKINAAKVPFERFKREFNGGAW